MSLHGKVIGFALTGSHCTIADVLPQIENLIQLGAEIVPIISHTISTTNTRFGNSEKWIDQLKNITSQPIISTIIEAEPLGPSKKLDCLVIAPCTGNTISKFANAMTDSPVLMAAKAQLRNQKPVVIAISTNDALGLNAFNIAKLLNTKNIYFVPFGQDDPNHKPNSLISNMNLIIESCMLAIKGVQLQPLLIKHTSV